MTWTAASIHAPARPAQPPQPADTPSMALWAYRSKADLERDDPSLKDGLDPQKLKLWRRQAIQVIEVAGRALRVPQQWIWVAAMLWMRFFSYKSMKANDRFLIAEACLLLAAKMGEVRLAKDKRDYPDLIVRECLKVRWAKTGKDWDKQSMEAMQSGWWQREVEETRIAEFVVLYALGFEFNSVSHPYQYLENAFIHVGVYKVEERTVQPPVYINLVRNAWAFLNDSMRTSLPIQYTPRVLAMGALFTANVISKGIHGPEGDIMTAVRRLPYHADNFLDQFQITKQQAEDIADQLLSMYEDAKLERDKMKTAHTGTEAPEPGQPDAPPNTQPDAPPEAHPGTQPGTPLMSPAHSTPQAG